MDRFIKIQFLLSVILLYESSLSLFLVYMMNLYTDIIFEFNLDVNHIFTYTIEELLLVLLYLQQVNICNTDILKYYNIL